MPTAAGWGVGVDWCGLAWLVVLWLEVMLVIEVVSWSLGFGGVGFEGLPLSCGMRGIHVLSEGSGSQTADLHPALMMTQLPLPLQRGTWREAKKCSGHARINLLVKSLVSCYAGNTHKSQLRKQVPTRDEDSSFLG